MANKRSSIELLKHHDHIITNMLYALSDHVQALMEVLPRCSCQEHLLTVVNLVTEEAKCDRCCATLINDAKKLASVLRIDVIERSERNWVDMAFAEAFRNIEMHYEQITEDDVVVH